MEAICTRAVIIDRGRIVADGTPANLLARSRHHNSVTLSLPVAQSQTAMNALQRQPGVASVEEVSRGGEIATITVFPKENARLIDRVTQLAISEHWDVRELYAEAGRLDDVFRAITTPDAQRARERKVA